MAISSIHFASGHSGYFDHNSRETPTNNAIFSDEENYCSANKDEAFKIYREELEIRSQAYTDRTGQKLQKSTNTHMSAIFNFNHDTTVEQAQAVCEYLEKKLGTKVVQMSMHRDEGHIIEVESEDLHNKLNVSTAIKNYHGHIEMLGLDDEGKSVRKKLDKPTLREIQTEVAKILGMERGRETSYSKEEYLQITSHMLPKEQYADKKEYNRAFGYFAKELGLYKEPKARRLDTYDWKKAKEMEAEATKELKKELIDVKEEVQTLKFDKKELEKQLKELNGKFRKELQQNGALRADYAQLEALNKELKEDIKSKNLTAEKLNSKFDNLQKSLLKKEDEIKQLKSSNKQLEKQNVSKDEKINTLENQNKSLQAQKEVLEDKVITLEEKVATNQNMSDYKAIKEEIIDNKENIEVFEKAYELPKTGNLNKLLLWVVNKFNEFKEIIKDKDYEIAVLTDEISDLKREQSSLLNSEKEKDNPLNKILSDYQKVKDPERSEASSLQKTEVKEGGKVDLSRFINAQKPKNSFLDKLNAIDEKNNAEIDTKINTKKGRDRD